jgi:hypothetical protein
MFIDAVFFLPQRRTEGFTKVHGVNHFNIYGSYRSVLCDAMVFLP